MHSLLTGGGGGGNVSDQTCIHCYWVKGRGACNVSDQTCFHCYWMGGGGGHVMYQIKHAFTVSYRVDGGGGGGISSNMSHLLLPGRYPAGKRHPAQCRKAL